MPSMSLNLRVTPLCLLPCLLGGSVVQAAAQPSLAQLINAYRARPADCPRLPATPVPALALNPKLALAPGYAGGMRDGLKANGYQAAIVRAIRLDGPENTLVAFAQLRAGYCAALLDGQYADIGVSQVGTHWQVVLARPLLDTSLSDPRAAAQALLAQVNAARGKPRLCGAQRFSAAKPLAWSPALASAALQHSQSMALGNYFAHAGPQGDTPYDRARAAGYRGRQVGENIAAGQGSPTAAMAGWLASPGHCANLMNPLFTQVGASYTAMAASQNGIYWTMVFGAP